MNSILNGASALVTGGSGTWGNAFIPRALKDGVRRICIFSRDEMKQSVMAQKFDDERLRFFLGDVRDRDRLRIALQDVDYVFHAAALKQIPAGEYNPGEFIRTNILGTENVLMTAAEVGVKRVIVLSSDKAAAPVTLYGSTKSVAEHLVRAGQHYNPNGTLYAAVRYGNVANSRGSVIPVWRRLLSQGVTELPITHPKMTRFFFQIEDAVSFALWALEQYEPGTLYVPKMPSFKVTDLAEAMGAKTHIIGLRGAEKIAEAMVTEDEAPYFRLWQGRYCRFREPVFSKGKCLPEGFTYRSDNNEEWLTVADLRRLLDETPAHAMAA